MVIEDLLDEPRICAGLTDAEDASGAQDGGEGMVVGCEERDILLRGEDVGGVLNRPQKLEGSEATTVARSWADAKAAAEAARRIVSVRMVEDQEYDLVVEEILVGLSEVQWKAMILPVSSARTSSYILTTGPVSPYAGELLRLRETIWWTHVDSAYCSSLAYSRIGSRSILQKW
jgi:hypothetical protein